MLYTVSRVYVKGSQTESIKNGGHGDNKEHLFSSHLFKIVILM